MGNVLWYLTFVLVILGNVQADEEVGFLHLFPSISIRFFFEAACVPARFNTIALSTSAGYFEILSACGCKRILPYRKVLRFQVPRLRVSRQWKRLLQIWTDCPSLLQIGIHFHSAFRFPTLLIKRFDLQFPSHSSVYFIVSPNSFDFFPPSNTFFPTSTALLSN